MGPINTLLQGQSQSFLKDKEKEVSSGEMSDKGNKPEDNIEHSMTQKLCDKQGLYY